MNDVRRTQDLYAEGITSHELTKQVASGELLRLCRGVYGAPVRLSPEQAHRRLVQATLPQLGPDAVASHASAAILLGLPVEGRALGRVHVTRRSALHGRARANLAQHTYLLMDDEVVLIEGIACTSAIRTAIDLGLTSQFEWAVGACDAVLHRRLADPDQLSAACGRAKGRHGVGSARAAVAFADGRAESILESISRVQIHRLGLPAPVLQHPIELDGRVVAFSDFAWPELRVVGEADGVAKYGDQAFDQRSGTEVIRDEKRREEDIRDAEWFIVRWDWAVAHRPAVLERRIRAGFAHAARGLVA